MTHPFGCIYWPMSFHNRVIFRSTKGQPKSNLSWVTWWKIKGDKKSNNLVTPNLMLIKTTFSCHSLQQYKTIQAMTKKLWTTIEIFWAMIENLWSLDWWWKLNPCWINDFIFFGNHQKKIEWWPKKVKSFVWWLKIDSWIFWSSDRIFQGMVKMFLDSNQKI